MKYSLILAALLAAAGAAAEQTGEPTAPEKPAAPPARDKPAAPPAAAVPTQMAFKPSELDLAPGERYRVELFVPGRPAKPAEGKRAAASSGLEKITYSPAEALTVVPDDRWTGKVPKWGAKTYPFIAAGRDASGDLAVRAEVQPGREAVLQVRIVSPGIEVIPQHRQLTVRVTNPFRARPLTGRIGASNPDRFLQDIVSREFRIAPGETADLVFPLPGAAAAEGETYEFTFLVETYQGYRDQKTYSLAFPSQPDK